MSRDLCTLSVLLTALAGLFAVPAFVRFVRGANDGPPTHSLALLTVAVVLAFIGGCVR